MRAAAPMTSSNTGILVRCKGNNRILSDHGRSSPRGVPRRRRPSLGHQCRGGPGRHAARRQRADRAPRAGAGLLAVRPRQRAAEADAGGPSLLRRSQQGADRHRPADAGGRADPHRPDRAARHRQPPERRHLAAAGPGLGLSGRAAGRARAPAVAQLRRHQPAAADRELRYRHRRAADRRDRSAVDALSHALRGDTAGRARAQRAQGADAGAAVGPSGRCAWRAPCRRRCGF